MCKLQLFCFSCAGGSAEFFNVLRNDLKNVDLVALDYAGHGKRYKEKFYKDFSELASDLFFRIKNIYNGGNYSLFGYSMGAIAAIEVLKKIIESELPLPSYIFLAAHEPHAHGMLKSLNLEYIDEWVKERTIEFGGIPERLYNNSAFWRTYLPLYKSDYILIGKYKFELLPQINNIPVVIFYSETDTPLESMKEWKKYFRSRCEFIRFHGNHFFINEYHEIMAKTINERVQVKD